MAAGAGGCTGWDNPRNSGPGQLKGLSSRDRNDAKETEDERTLIFGFLMMGVISCTRRRPQSPRRPSPRGHACTPKTPPAKIAGPRAQAAAPAEESGSPAPRPATVNGKITTTTPSSSLLPSEDLNKLENAVIGLVEARRSWWPTSTASSSRRESTRDLEGPGPRGELQLLLETIALGELISVRADSRSIGEEFYDLEAREKAKKVEEEPAPETHGRLRRASSTRSSRSSASSPGSGARSSGMQGARVLGNLSSLATVTVTAREIQGYVPTQAPHLRHQNGRSFCRTRSAHSSISARPSCWPPWP